MQFSTPAQFVANQQHGVPLPRCLRFFWLVRGDWTGIAQQAHKHVPKLAASQGPYAHHPSCTNIASISICVQRWRTETTLHTQPYCWSEQLVPGPTSALQYNLRPMLKSSPGPTA